MGGDIAPKGNGHRNGGKFRRTLHSQIPLLKSDIYYFFRVSGLNRNRIKNIPQESFVGENV